MEVLIREEDSRGRYRLILSMYLRSFSRGGLALLGEPSLTELSSSWADRLTDYSARHCKGITNITYRTT